MRLRIISLCAVIAVMFFWSFGTAKNKKGTGATSLRKTTLANPTETELNINNITSWITREAFFPWNWHSSWNGSYPRGTAGAIFAEGPVWGARVVDNDSLKLRVGGSTYDNGLQAGKVLGWSPPSAPGGYVAPTGTEVADQQQAWRVRKDYATADLSADAASFNMIGTADVTEADEEALRDQYKHDWDNWPADKGAPYEDVDGSGDYDPTKDIPGFPGASQTIWVVANDLDDAIAEGVYGSPGIGLELQFTYWAYDFASSHALGNILFKRIRFIYTGKVGGPVDARIDTMYLTQWSDPDLGTYTDDYVGTDVDASLGYVYNGNVLDGTFFGDFGLAVPAAGYDFLQGPIVSDSAGNPDTLGMSSFVYFGAGSAVSDPDLGTYEGTLQWFNLMEGFKPRPAYPAREPFVDPLTGLATKYVLSGDPVTGTGWIDGMVLPPGDRRLVMTTGPFKMALGDTQDVVLALGAGMGQDNISSVTVLKFYDTFAQYAYDNDFSLPSPPPSPVVDATEYDGRIVLNWGSDSVEVATTEKTVSQGFAFEGYNVYQLPTAASTLDDAKRVATFDEVNLVQTIFDPGVDPKTGFVIAQAKQFGANSGVQRYYSTDEDAVRSRPMSNGVTYYFAVTAYSYLADNAGAPFKTLESSPTVIPVTPQAPIPGTKYDSKYADLIDVTHDGSSTARLNPVIIDPSSLQTAAYTVYWKYYNPSTGAQLDALSAGDTLSDGSPFPTGWNLTKNGTVVKKNEKVEYAEGDFAGNAPIVDGAFQLQVFNPPSTALQSWSYEGNRWISGTNWGGAGLFGGLDLGYNFFGSDIPESEIVYVQLVFQDQAGVDANGYIGKGAVHWRSDSYNYAGVGELPFAAYDLSDPANPRRLNISFVEDANEGSTNLLWDMGWDGTAFADVGGREYTFIHSTDYQDDGLYYGSTNDATYEDVMWAFWPAARGSRAYLLEEFTLDIVPSIKAGVRVGSEGDLFSFSTVAADTGVDSLAKAEVEKINVFPNPYYGFHELEPNRYDKFLTFNHLPRKATIRIFNLGGQMVRVIEKNDASQFARWNMQNQNGYPVASGIYIAHVDMPDLGKSKILKLALIQEEQIIRNY